MKSSLRFASLSAGLFARAVCLLLVSPVVALGPQSSELPSSRPELLPLDQVELYLLPPVDVERLLREDEAAARGLRHVPLRVGYPVATDLGPAASGTWEALRDGGRLWRLRVRSAGARWLVLGFGTYRLPPGGELWVRDPNLGVVLGPFGPDDVRPHGQLWMPPVEGDTLIIELLWPDELARVEPRLHLGTVVHGYKSVWDRRPAEPPQDVTEPLVSGPCNIDVNCPLGADWQDAKRGVVHLLSGGSSFCTGSLINNTANDCKPYVLTARHCLSTQSAAAATTFRFNYERPACESGTAPTDQLLTGSTLVATYLNSDVTLLRLDGSPPEAFVPYFNGWSRSTVPANESWCIHHPSGDVKKISYNDDPLIDGQAWGADHWRVTEWELGTTEGGSSGSPLFDPDQRIVGQLHGGYASCDNITWDEYGKLDVSWSGGGTAGTRLADWLDPLDAGVIGIDGIDLGYCLAPQPELAYAGYAVHEVLGNVDGTIDPGEVIALEILLENQGNLEATGVTGTIESLTSLVAVGDPDAVWPDLPPAAEGSTLAPHFRVQLDPACPCGEAAALRLVAYAAEVPEPRVIDLLLPIGRPVGQEQLFADDMESGTAGWQATPLTGTATWVPTTADSHSPIHSWYVKDGAEAYDTTLVMPVVGSLPNGARLTFEHRFDTEANRDGGVLEYSVDQGAVWHDAGPLLITGSYGSSIGSGESSPLAGRPAWSGDSAGWQPVEADLESLAGEDLLMRWRFATNDSIGDRGWFVDDVVVSRTLHECAGLLAPPGEASDPAAGGGLLTLGRGAAGEYELSWSAPTVGGAPMGYGLYRWPLPTLASGSPECEAELGPTTTAVLPALSEDCGFLVVASNSLGEGSYGTDSAGQERPAAQGAAICP